MESGADIDIDPAQYAVNKIEEIVQLLMHQNELFRVNKVEEIVQLLMHQNELFIKQNELLEKLVEQKDSCCS